MLMEGGGGKGGAKKRAEEKEGGGEVEECAFVMGFILIFLNTTNPFCSVQPPTLFLFCIIRLGIGLPPVKHPRYKQYTMQIREQRHCRLHANPNILLLRIYLAQQKNPTSVFSFLSFFRRKKYAGLCFGAGAANKNQSVGTRVYRTHIHL